MTVRKPAAFLRRGFLNPTGGDADIDKRLTDLRERREKLDLLRDSTNAFCDHLERVYEWYEEALNRMDPKK